MSKRHDEVLDHRDRALRLAWRLVGGDQAAAEDVTQEALLRAHRSLTQFREEAALETWFYRILVRQASNYRRWNGVRRFWMNDPGDEPADFAEPTPAAPGDPALRRRISAALDTLTRRQREVFVLVYLEGYSVSEAAEILGKPSGTLKSHLQRARVGMRAQLSDLWKETAEGA